MHRHTFPDGVAHQAGVQSVADAHERCLLLDRSDGGEIFEPILTRILDEAVHFEMPQVHIHARIDNVFRHAIKQFIRRDRLNDTAFVLRSVITKRSRAIKFPHQTNATAGNEHAEPAQDQRAPSNCWSELLLVASSFCTSEKVKPGYKGSFKSENSERETDQRDQSRRINRQSAITCPEHRPERDRGRDDRQDDEYPNCCRCNAPRRITPHDQTENRAAESTNKKLARHCRSNTELLQMIVAADSAHDGEKRSRRNENREPIADNRERRRDAETCEDEHDHRHRDAGYKSGEQAGG